MNNGRINIGSIGYTYNGSDSDVEHFLFAIVRDYFNTFKAEDEAAKQLPQNALERGFNYVISAID